MWYDNFPNVILESFAYKKAVVATDFGSLPELVKDGRTGFTFKYADVVDFRQKIRKMFDNPEMAQQMGENSYKVLIKEYSPEVHYEKLMGLFASVLKEAEARNNKK